MVKEVNKELIRNLYRMKSDGGSALDIVLAEMTKTNNMYLNFLLYILFCDLCSKLSCPRPLAPLFRSRKMVAYLTRRLLGKDIVPVTNGTKNTSEEQYKRIKTSDSMGESDYVEIMEFLLNMEKTNKKISRVDKPFIALALSKIPETKKTDLIRFTGVTPLSILVMRTMSPTSLSTTQLGIMNLLKAKGMSHENGFIHAHDSEIDFRTLRRMFLRSKFSEIQKHLHTLVKLYPEMTYGAKKLYSDRLDIFLDPLSIPIDAKLLRTYIPASIHFIKHKLGPEGQMQNLGILLKTIYIERILAKHPSRSLLKNVVHQLILESPVLVKIIVTRGFERSVVGKVIRHVPSFHLAYDISLRMLCKDPANQFYSTLTEKLLEKYPVEGNVEKLKACVHLLRKTFLEKFDHLLKQ